MRLSVQPQLLTGTLGVFGKLDERIAGSIESP